MFDLGKGTKVGGSGPGGLIRWRFRPRPAPPKRSRISGPVGGVRSFCIALLKIDPAPRNSDGLSKLAAEPIACIASPAYTR